MIKELLKVYNLPIQNCNYNCFHFGKETNAILLLLNLSKNSNNVAFSGHFVNFAALIFKFEALWLLFAPSALRQKQIAMLVEPQI